MLAEIGTGEARRGLREIERRGGARARPPARFTLTEAVGEGELKWSEKEAAKHMAARMVTANVATALARCPNECILLLSSPTSCSLPTRRVDRRASLLRGGAGDFSSALLPLFLSLSLFFFSEDLFIFSDGEDELKSRDGLGPTC